MNFGTRHISTTILSTDHIPELCLHLTVGLGPCQRRRSPTLALRSCERVMLTMGTFSFFKRQCPWKFNQH